MEIHHHTVPDEAHGQRLDVFVTAREPTLSRSQVARAVERGEVLVAGRPATKGGQKLVAGDEVVVTLVDPTPAEAQPEALPLVVRHEDADLVVLAKPVGVVVHPAHGHATGTLVNALLHHCGDLSGIGGVLRPGIVHRLDQDTSGLLVVAKNDLAHRALAAQFAARTVYRRYLALVHGGARTAAGGTFRTLYGRHATDRKRFSSRVGDGKEAVTHWHLLLTAPGLHLVEVRLETGRTHQIRVHFADAGHPLVGDAVYGGRQKAPHALAAALPHQALHAYALGFQHPTTGAWLTFREPPPDSLREVLDGVFGGEAVTATLAPLLEAVDRIW